MNAILTGASSGIGRALAPLLVQAGYHVGLVGRDAKGLEDLKQALHDSSRFEVLPTDLSDIEAVKTVCSRYGKDVDLLVNCAGIAVTGKLEDIPSTEFERIWKINFLSPVTLCQAVLPQMKERKRGMIVNVTSGVSRRALPFISPYSSAKAALNSFTESLRVETQDSGIDVCLFFPGPVEQRFHANTVHYGKGKLKFPPFHGQMPDTVAARLMRAITHKEKVVALGGKTNVAHHMNYWAPQLTDRLVKMLYRMEEPT